MSDKVNATMVRIVISVLLAVCIFVLNDTRDTANRAYAKADYNSEYFSVQVDDVKDKHNVDIKELMQQFTDALYGVGKEMGASKNELINLREDISEIKQTLKEIQKELKGCELHKEKR